MKVEKRNGSFEKISFDKILERIQSLCDVSMIDLPKFLRKLNIDSAEITKTICDELYDGVKTSEIDKFIARKVMQMITIHPDYGKLGSRITISDHHKNTLDTFHEKISFLYEKTDLISKQLYEVTMKYKDEIEKKINYDNDYTYDYFAFKTLERSYLLKYNDNLIERPQDMLMRVSLGLHPNDLNSAFHSYELLSQKYFIHASPTLFNSGTTHPQLLSCFLLGIGDSVHGIYKCLADCAQISKWAGGIGIHTSNIRGNGSLIKGTNGKTSGLVPMLKVFNDTACFINQGGKRNGSFAIYLEPHHPDILNFLDLKKNHGNEAERARDLFYAVWISDLFMKRVRNNEKWSLFSSDDCKNLENVYGEEYEKLYLKYEQEKKYRKQIDSRKIWTAILQAQIETGTPYIGYKDHVNRKSNQKNLGTIKSSNLCVAPETKILTKNGYFMIQDLENQYVDIWNGEEFSKSLVKKTGENQELIKIEFDNGSIIECTPYHKFYVSVQKNNYKYSRKIIKIDACELEEGMNLIKCEYPIIDNDNDNFKYPYTHGFFCADGTYRKSNDKHRCNFKKINDSDFCKRHTRFNSIKERYDFDDNICNALVGIDKPIVYLYENKKKLINNFTYDFKFENNNRICLELPYNIERKYKVPINYSLDVKLKWLAGLFDGDGCLIKTDNSYSIQIASIHKDFLENVKYLLQTVGIDIKIKNCRESGKYFLPNHLDGYSYYDCKKIYRLTISSYYLDKLLKLGFKTYRLNIPSNIFPNRNAKKYIQVNKIIETGRVSDTYCFNEPKKNMGIFNGIIAGNCIEINEYSDDREYACCTLASLALPSFVKEHTLKPTDTIKIIGKDGCIYCDKSKELLDKYSLNYTYEKMNNKMDRIKMYEKLMDEYDGVINSVPLIFVNNEYIGGYQELKNKYFKLHFDFELLGEVTRTAIKNLNKVIDLNYYPVPETKLSNERHRPLGLGVQGLADAFIKMRLPFDSQEAKDLNKKIFESIYYYAMVESLELSKKDGPYSSFQGSPISQGKFQFDLWKTSHPNDHFKLSGMYDWDTLREQIKQFGVRNSLLVALMPTASTSQILGNNECFEPYTSNIYTRSTLAGEFVVMNKWLIQDLIDRNLWCKELKDKIVYHFGSIQAIDEIPDDLKKLYKTVWEIKQKVLIDLSADRGYFVDQSQSLNLFVANPNINTLSKMHMYGWKKGLKTGIYYLRQMSAAHADQFSLDMETIKKMNTQKKKEIKKEDELDKIKQLNYKNEDVCESCQG